jgi:DNA-binding response OmpR family regulator
VDDDEGTAERSETSFPGKGIVSAQPNRSDAIRLTRERRPAIALIDMKLPDITGLEAYLAIKRKTLP